MTAVALLLSRVFHPTSTGAYVLLAVGLAQAHDRWSGALWALVLAAISAGVPALDLARRAKAGEIESLDLVAREKRRGPLLVMVASQAAGLVVAFGFGAPHGLRVALVAGLAAGMVVTAVTAFWKISVHAGSAAGGVALLTWAYGPAALVAAPLVPAIAWARVALRRHTVAQVVVGAVSGIVVVCGVIAAFG